jgi:DNA primase catalytic core
MTTLKLSTMEIQEIKERLSIETVLSHYDLRPDKHHLLKCPFHDDKDPSLKIYPETNTFNCFGCGATGDVIEFIERYDKRGKHEAIIKAQGLTGTPPAMKLPPLPVEPVQSLKERTEILSKIFESFKHGLRHPVSVKPKEYLKKRNLTSDLLDIGYNSGQFHHRGKLSDQDQQACIRAGLLIPYSGSVPNGNGTTYTPFAKDCIVFPLRDKQDQIISLYGRSIQESRNGSGKHFYLKNRTGLYPCYPKPETQKLILTEAIIDAATLLQIPEVTSDYSILACYGTNGLTDEHKAVIKDLQKLQEVIFFFDGDKAGQEGIKHDAESLHDLLPDIKISYVDTPEGEDINSLSVTYDSDIFTSLLNERKLFLLTEKPSPESLSDKKEKETEPDPEPVRSTGRLDTRNPAFITYTTDELQITILGGVNLQQLDRLRITIKINRTDTGDPLHSIRHTLDLYHSDYLEKFINKASDQLETGTNVLRRALAELTEQVEAYRLSKIESLKEQRPGQRVLTEQRHRRAKGYLGAPRLMQHTGEDIGRTGVVGEEINRLLMYLVFTSRLRDQPLHIVSLGASGTGKTYLQEKISELIPEQDKIEITILSENAFYYFDRKELKHKLVLIEDMDGAKDVLYPLRELQTKQYVIKTVPIKDSKGNLHTVRLHVEGPICFAGTTTMERLYEDNANRCLLIYIDNSHEHRELIMEYQRRLSAGKVNMKEENELKEFFKDMQSVLKPIKVRNPYAEYLKLPEYVFKPLRTNAHYLAVIETITFYHQYQREVKTDQKTGEQYIETTIEDIEWANKLLKDILLAKSDELSGECRGFFERLKRWVKAEGKASFFATQVREAFRMNPSNLKYYLIQLSRYGYIKPVGGDRYKRGYEYEVINFDDYQKLNTNIISVFDDVLNKIKNKISGQRG